MRSSRLLLAVVPLAAAAALPAPAAAASNTVWLCRPDLKRDPCHVSLNTTRFSPKGKKLGVNHIRPVQNRKVDCFYVYPTVSDQKRTNATRRIDPEERSIALYQTARYSRYCRVFAPMYRQLTLRAIGDPSKLSPKATRIAYDDVRDAFRNYLRYYNHGRGFVLVGHSQGSFVLRTVIKNEIDRKPAVRRRLVSALLLGGNVLVKKGSDRGGDFQNVPACRSSQQFRCVVAFSTYNDTVPADSKFGRANAGFGGTTNKNLRVLCTNPAALGGGTAPITPLFPEKPFAPKSTIGVATRVVGFPIPKAATTWVAFPNAYRAHCSSKNGANVLQITSIRGAPKLNSIPDKTWGLHLTDANIALGNLEGVVRREIAAYAKARG